MIIYRMFCAIRKQLDYMPVLFLFLLPTGSSAQDRNMDFNIIHQGDLKGTVHLSEHSAGNIRRIKVESLIQTRFLFNITVKTIEEAIYREGLLISSSFYQKINDQVPSDRAMTWKDGSYQSGGSQNTGKLPRLPVEHTILSLYYKEPVNIREVFSDNFQQYLPVSKTAAGQYRVDLPNGNSTYYIYQQGKLVRVEVAQPFYALQFILKP